MRYLGRLQDKSNSFPCPINYSYMSGYPNHRWYTLSGVEGVFLYRNNFYFVGHFQSEAHMLTYLGRGIDDEV